jgi:hypothetical protein
MTDFLVTRNLIRDAFEKGMTVSAFLERLDPTHKYPAHERRLDAFQRQLARLDIRTASSPMAGIPAHSFDRFFENPNDKEGEGRWLAAEWISRQYREAAQVVPRTNFGVRSIEKRSPAVMTGSPLSDVLWPDALDPAMRFQELEPSLLSTFVGRTRMIDSDTFKAFYLDDATVEADARMKRVTEYGEIPTMKIVGSDHTINAYKYGRRLQASYESMRRMSLDLISWAIQYIAAKADNDKFLTALDVLLNGDGNSGTAATNTNGSTYDGGAGGALTLKMWLGWGMIWSRPHRLNVVVGQNAGIVDLLLLNAGSANLPPSEAVRIPGAVGDISLARPIYGGIVAVNDSTMTANKLLGFDNRYSLEMVLEAGADIVEFDRIAQRQYEEVMISEVVGFDIMTLGQNKVLSYTA